MCIAAVLFSLIPILSGYTIYLFIFVVATEAPPVVQLTLLALVLMALGLGTWQLVRYLRARRRRVLTDEPGGVDELEKW